MTTTDPFDVFDHPHPITRVAVTEGHTDQETGEWVPGTTASTAIAGSLEDLTLRDLQRLPEGEYTLGDRRIHTGARLVPGDRLEVVEPDGTPSRWAVRALEKQTSFLVHHGIDRRTYLLKRLI